MHIQTSKETKEGDGMIVRERIPHRNSSAKSSSSVPRALAIALLLGGVTSISNAQMRKSPTSLDQKTIYHSPFHRSPNGVELSTVVDGIPNAGDWQRYLSSHGPQSVFLDSVTGRAVSVSGTGIPWIPGLGNTLSLSDLAGVMNGPKSSAGIPELEAIARGFIADNATLFRIPPQMGLKLNPIASSAASPTMWSLRFDLSYGDTPIEGGAVIFVIKHGNLILWGTTGLDDIALPAAPILSPSRAIQLVESFVGGFLPGLDLLVDSPSLRIVPEQLESLRGYREVWDVRFERQNEGSYLARVDAHSGDILEFRDDNSYAQVKGGIYPVTNTNGTEVSRPLGFADYLASTYADSGGSFTYTSGTVTSTLKGKYVTIVDKCGAASLSATTSPGDLDFSAGTGTNCTTPGVGGAGNTHAARSCYYHVDLIKQKGRAYLPSNAWLQAKLTSNVNLTGTCNAFWSPTQKTINFYQTISGCANTGEISAIFLHEWGHGMDSNDGNGAQGSGEAMGDTVAMLQIRNSCIGQNLLSGNCGGYGNACKSCTGVRDQDRAKHQTNEILTPKTIFNRCGAGAQNDVCGLEVHCEGELAGNTVWDLAAVDLPARADLTSDDAWALADKL